MANAKRASMREGPLAALFRKTDISEEEQAGVPAARASRDGALPHPALSASPDTPADEANAYEARVPSPQERLRNAFSSDIPESLMERPERLPEVGQSPIQTASWAGAHPLHDYADEQPTLARVAAQAGQPIIRVVGVGGGG